MRVASKLTDESLSRHLHVDPACRALRVQRLAHRLARAAKGRTPALGIGRLGRGRQLKLLRLAAHQQVERELLRVDRNGILRSPVENVDRHRVGGIVVYQFCVIVLLAKFDERAVMRPLGRVCMGMPTLLHAGLSRHGGNATRDTRHGQPHPHHATHSLHQSHRMLLLFDTHPNTDHSANSSRSAAIMAFSACARPKHQKSAGWTKKSSSVELISPPRITVATG